MLYGYSQGIKNMMVSSFSRDLKNSLKELHLTRLVFEYTSDKIKNGVAMATPLVTPPDLKLDSNRRLLEFPQ